MQTIKTLAWLGAVASLSLASPLLAVTWDGGGANNNWSTANNWNPNGAPAAGSQLLFPPGALKLTNVNDFADLTNFQSLQLSSANYNIGGNDIRLSNGILSSHASGTNILALGIELTQSQSFTVQNTGAFLTINGDVDAGTFALSVGGLGNTILGGRVLGSGELVKNGPGFLRVQGDNLYSGGTTVNGGTLDVKNAAGSGTGSGPVIVENGAELQGDGAIGGEVLIMAGGKVSPGDDEPALLATGNLILDTDGVLVVQVNGEIPGTEYSALEVTGTVVLNQAIFRMALGEGIGAGDDYKIIDNDGNDQVTGTFKDLSQNETFRIVGRDEVGFKINYQGGDGNDVVLSSIPTLSINDVTVAEPASGTATATFVAELTEASDETITVKYATAAGTAIAGDDYTVANGTLTFDPGITRQNIVVSIKSDELDEGEEEFSVKLFTPSNASIARELGKGLITPPEDQPGSGGNNGGSGSGNPPGFPVGSADSGGCSLRPGVAGPAGLPWIAFGIFSAAVTGCGALRVARRR